MGAAHGLLPSQVWDQLPPRLIVAYYEDVEWRRLEEWVAMARANGHDVEMPERPRNHQKAGDDYETFKKRWAAHRALERMGQASDINFAEVDPRMIGG